MTYLVVSDIHGSSLYFEKVLKYFKENKIDKMIILGDILYHGPRNDLPSGHNVKKLIEQLNSIKDDIIAIKGNCDAEVDQMVLEFKLHDDYYLNIEGINYYLTHGHHINPSSPIKLDNVDVVLFGHSHIPSFDIIEGVCYFNPGSISLPKNYSRHSFALIKDKKIALYDSDYQLLYLYEVDNYVGRN